MTTAQPSNWETYWYPKCRKCKREKMKDNSHCDSHTCPWCVSCAPQFKSDKR